MTENYNIYVLFDFIYQIGFYIVILPKVTTVTLKMDIQSQVRAQMNVALPSTGIQKTLPYIIYKGVNLCGSQLLKEGNFAK